MIPSPSSSPYCLKFVLRDFAFQGLPLPPAFTTTALLRVRLLTRRPRLRMWRALHAGTPAIALRAAACAVAAHTGTPLIVVGRSGAVGVVAALVRMLHAAVAADQAVITVASAVRLAVVGVLHAAVAADQAVITVASAVRLVVVGVLHAAVAADQAVITIASAVWLAVVGVLHTAIAADQAVITISSAIALIRAVVIVVIVVRCVAVVDVSVDGCARDVVVDDRLVDVSVVVEADATTPAT